MSDDITPPEQAPNQPLAEPLAVDSPASTTSPRRRLLVIGLGAALFGLVVALALFFVFGGGSSSDKSTQDEVQTAAAQTAPAAPATTAEAPPPEPAQVPITEVFTYRDIFEPLIKPKTETSGSGQSGESAETSGTATESGGGSTEDTSTSEVSENSILLQDITVEDGVPTAILVFNGVTYSAHEGDQIDDSAWKVLKIEESSVVMLYGDTQVVLSVGQAVTK